jgi:predicted dehydrogenase/nucleoside-diphosphate-sugar epimerase
VSQGTRQAPLRVAVAGAGTMARHHLRALREMGTGVELAGVADPSRAARDEALERAPGARGYDDLDALLADREVDVVHVCTPMETHAALAMTALERDCHVYVEKPVTPATHELEPLLAEAERRGLLVCAGHQVLFEAPYRRILELLPALGTPVHVESHFAFRPVRTSGRRPLTLAEQLIDVLPHPTYLLLDVLERADPQGAREVAHLELSREGTVHGVVRRGGVVGTLLATLEGRPVEHWLRVVGTNGTLHADFVRGTVQRLLGPGSSGIDKALNPFRLSGQLALGTTAALGRRVARRGGSYPGLAELFGAFHRAIREKAPSPTSPDQIRGTVELCAEVGRRIREGEEELSRSSAGLEADPGAPPPHAAKGPDVLVTGGTGLLGREVVRSLRGLGRGVRAVSRRVPAARHRMPGVEYVAADLAGTLPEGLLDGIRVVVHCAAETAGGWDEHRRNSVEATERLVREAAKASVETFVQVSSVAVLESTGPRRRVRDNAPLHSDPERLGPYAWGKAESERSAREIARDLGLRLKVVRPVPLVDRARFQPPGRLGRRVGNVYVAVGSPREPLVVADAAATGRAVARVALSPDAVPDALNLVPGTPPTRRELVRALREASPEVSVIWLPRLLLHPLSWGALAAQKVLRPGRPAVRLAPAFAAQRYEPGPAAALMSEPIEAPEAEGTLDGGAPERTPERVRA